MAQMNQQSEYHGAVPRHVAIIMDGNGRWAKAKFMPRIVGHRAGVESVRDLVQASTRMGVEVLTLFAFSSENWRRPEKEVGLLMELFISALQRETKKLSKNNVRLRVIGDRSRFSDKLQREIALAEEVTADNTGLILVVAADYGGRWDVLNAMKSIIKEVESGAISPDSITEDMISSQLSMADLPEPDLFIRTGGEQRISNFLLWQLAYAELYFTEVLWPDFKVVEFEKAVASYSGRQRRFGRTGDQVEEVQGA